MIWVIERREIIGKEKKKNIIIDYGCNLKYSFVSYCWFFWFWFVW